MESTQKYLDHAVELAIDFGPKLVLALFVLIIGLWVIRGFTTLLGKVLAARKVDVTLTTFLGSLLNWTLRALLFISVASMVGIETTSFVAVLGAAGLAVGLALQGSLANFAGGALILMFRPYQIGDLVEAQGHLGVVKEIQIFTTVLVTLDNRRVIVPNGAMSNGSIINYTVEGKIRVDLVIGVSYDADIDAAKKVLLEVMNQHDKVMADPAPYVGVEALADSSVNLVVRPFCDPAHYWDVYFDITENSKKALDAANISIPFPQRDVHVYEHKND